MSALDRPLSVALVQLSPEKGQPERNISLLTDAFSTIAGESLDLLVLPEAALTGYFLEGGVLECARTSAEMAQLLGETWQRVSPRPIEIVAGFFEIDDGVLYNSSIALSITDQHILTRHVHRKLFLPTYGLFDEARFVTRGRHLRCYDGVGGRTAMMICEDMWHALVPTLAALQGARLLIVPSASPGRGFAPGAILPQSLERWQAVLRHTAAEHGCFVLYAGLAGFEGGKGMTGASMAIDPFGELLVQAPLLEPMILRVDLDLTEIALARAALPLIGDLQEIAPDLLSDVYRSRGVSP